jgi:hypothetical protein
MKEKKLQKVNHCIETVMMARIRMVNDLTKRIEFRMKREREKCLEKR